MNYIPYICIAALAVASILQRRRANKYQTELAALRDNQALLGRVHDVMAREMGEAEEKIRKLTKRVADLEAKTDKRFETIDEKLKKADEILVAHAELEKEAANSERMFQEGLANLLNYGVSK